MRSSWSLAMVMPNSQQRQEVRRQGAMNGQMRSDNAMPIFDGTTGPYGLIPGGQKRMRNSLPGRVNALQQVSSGRTQHGSTQPRPRQQSDGLGSQLLVCLFLYHIKSASKQQRLRQSQTDLLREHLKLPLQRRSGRWHQLIQQVQHADDLALTEFTVEQAIRLGHDHLQQSVQFLAEIAHSISYIAHLRKACLLFSHGRLGTPSSCSYAICRSFGLPLDGEQTILFSLYRPVQASLDLRRHMEEVPDIPLMTALCVSLTQGFLDRPSSIAHCTRTVDPLLLHIPQQQGPTLAIDRYGRNAGPDLSTVDINHVQIGLTTLAAVLFIQGQGALRTGLLLTQPRSSTLPSFFDDANDLSQAQMNPMQFPQTRLNAPITGMRFDQLRQNQRGKCFSLLGWQGVVSQRFFQCLPSCCRPTVQGLTRYLVRTTQLTDQPIHGVRQHLTDHAHALLNSATMVHVSSLRTVMVFTFSPYLSGILPVNFLVNCHIGSSSL